MYSAADCAPSWSQTNPPNATRERDVKRRQLQTLRDADLVVALVEEAEVEGEQQAYDADEHQPEPQRLAQEQGD